MDYARIYNNLISKRETHRLNKSKTVFTELHHILPKCLGGTDCCNNLIRLTGKEHFIAHRLLSKIHHDSKPLSLAVLLMSRIGSYTIHSSREIERLRQLASSYSSESLKEKWCDEDYAREMSGLMRELWSTPEFRKKVSDSLKETFNKPEMKSKVKKARTELWETPEYRQAMDKLMASDEYRKAVSSGHLDKFLPDLFTKDDVRHDLWEKADQLFFLMEGNDSEIIPTSILKLCDLSREVRQQSKALTNRFKSGWNPLEDQRWLAYIDARLMTKIHSNAQSL